MKMIMSVDENWAIGSQNRLLFHIPPDMRYFREMTTGGAIIMGRKTWDSLPDGKPLANRVNIVMTRHPERVLPFGARREGVVICDSLASLSLALQKLPVRPDNHWVIGGSDIYRLLMPFCQEACVTKVMAVAADADCWMASLDESPGWRVVGTGETLAWEGLRYHRVRYRNARATPFP